MDTDGGSDEFDRAAVNRLNPVIRRQRQRASSDFRRIDDQRTRRFPRYQAPVRKIGAVREHLGGHYNSETFGHAHGVRSGRSQENQVPESSHGLTDGLRALVVDCHSVVQGTVGFDVSDSDARSSGQAVQGPDLVQDFVAQLGCRDTPFDTTESVPVGVGRMSSDNDPFPSCKDQSVVHCPRVTGVEATGDARARDRLQDRLVARRVRHLLAQIGVEVDRCHPPSIATRSWCAPSLGCERTRQAPNRRVRARGAPRSAARDDVGMAPHETVRAARLKSHSEPLQLEEVELAEPGPDEVLVSLAFSGVNPVDGYMAQGMVAADGPLPRTLGGEASGTASGRRVLVHGGGLGATRDGLWAAKAVVPRSAVVELPEGVGLADAAATGVAGLTAWNVIQLAQVETGDRVLVLGASGGVGLAIVSLAASLGADVWGQTTSAGKAQAVLEQGARQVVVTDAAGLTRAVEEFRPTVVVDPLGADFTQAGLASLSPAGRLVIFGTSAGPEGRVHLQNLYRNGLRVLGYGGLRLSDEERRKGLQAALQALKDGRMRIRIDRTLPLDEVNEALRLVSERKLTGKVLLDLS